VKIKWNTNNILLFLQVYQQYPTLWNIKDIDYSNKSLMNASLKELMSELKENQL
jgi:Alcohol dehydrogenase transcription factor Myb/SANT-like.